jgi:tubulin polyglutamylase TTLL6/13
MEVSPDEHLVAQRYLADPFLLDGLKFDLRIYVLLAGVRPLRIFIYKEGLVRLATEPYSQPTD